MEISTFQNKAILTHETDVFSQIFLLNTAELSVNQVWPVVSKVNGKRQVDVYFLFTAEMLVLDDPRFVCLYDPLTGEQS